MKDRVTAITPAGGRLLGSLGHCFLLAWLLAMVLLVPAARLPLSAALCLATIAWLYPASFKRLLRWQTLLLLGLVLAASLLIPAGGAGRPLSALPYFNLEGLKSGFLMVLRAVILLLALDGFSSSVDVSQVAGLAEKLGLRGLGFSVGVAFNMLPILRDSATASWYSLWMRGGLRRRPLHSLKLLALTIVGNALRRGEEIALAAEARAFNPQRIRAIPLSRGQLDLWMVLPLLVTFLAILMLPVPWIKR
jgi:energy-coupling factor transporter transmembrane protein EcfT